MADLLTALKKKTTDRVSAAASKLTADMLAEATSSALSQHGQSRPVEIVAKIAGSGGFDYPLTGAGAILSDWSVGFSQVLGIIFPYVVASQRQEEMESERYGVVILDTGYVLRLFDSSPIASQYMLIRYTARHSVTDDLVGPPPSTGESTIPDNEWDALADLVAAYCCDELASYYAQSTDPSISADVVNRLSKSQEYRSQAAQFRKSYAAKLAGGDEESLEPSGGFVHTDASFSNTIHDQYHFHDRRR